MAPRYLAAILNSYRVSEVESSDTGTQDTQNRPEWEKESSFPAESFSSHSVDPPRRRHVILTRSSSLFSAASSHPTSEIPLPPTRFDKFVDLCDDIYPTMTAITVGFTGVHAIIFLIIAIITSLGSVAAQAVLWLDKLINNKHVLSPFTPVWFNIDEFPYVLLFTYINAFSWLNTVIFAIICLLTVYTMFASFRKSKDVRSLMIFCALLLSYLKVFTLMHPDFYLKLVFELNDYMVLRFVENEYQLFGTNAFTSLFNVVMILGHCCGVEGPGDFTYAWQGVLNITIDPEDNPYEGAERHLIEGGKIPAWPKERMNITFKVPAACCPQLEIGDPVDKDWLALRSCVAGKNHNMSHYHMGCEESYDAFFKDHFMPIMLVDDIIALILLIIFSWLNICKLYWSPISTLETVLEKLNAQRWNSVTFSLPDSEF